LSIDYTLTDAIPMLRRSRLSDTAYAIMCSVACLSLEMVAMASDPDQIILVIKDHRFTPAEFEIPAGEKRMLSIENKDPTAEEFESHTLHREKILPANSTTRVFIGPLKPGRYEFFGEFNDATARGIVIVK
jgi:hypothetical protein